MSIKNLETENNINIYCHDMHVLGELFAKIKSGDINPGKSGQILHTNNLEEVAWTDFTTSNIPSGTNGQVLTTVGSNVEWANIPAGGTITAVEDDSTSIGTGTLVVNSPVTSGVAQIKKIVAGTNISLVNGTDDVTINSSNPGGTITRIEDDTVSVGTGTLVVASPVTSGIAQIKKLVAGSNITLTNGTDDVTIAATGGGGGTITAIQDDSISSGTGTLVVASPVTSGVAQIKKLVQGTGITLTNGTDDVTINGNLGTITTIQNDSVSAGTGTLVVASPVTSGTAQIKRLVAGTNITLTNGTDDVTITAAGGGTITGVMDGTASTGTGTLVISSPVTSGVAQIKKIIAGSNITLTNGTNDLTIAAAGGGGAGTEYSVAAAASDLPLLTSYRNITLSVPTTDGYPGKTSFLNTFTSSWTPTIGTKYMVSWNVFLINSATTGSIVSLQLYHGGTSPYTLLQENYCPSSTNGGMLTLNGTIMFSTAYSATMYFNIKKTDSSSSITIKSSQTTFTVYSLS